MHAGNDTDVTARFVTRNNDMIAHVCRIPNEIAELVTKAWGPSPTDITLQEAMGIALGGTPGQSAVSHDVCMCENIDEVDNAATTGMPVTITTFTPGPLELGEIYC